MVRWWSVDSTQQGKNGRAGSPSSAPYSGAKEILGWSEKGLGAMIVDEATSPGVVCEEAQRATHPAPTASIPHAIQQNSK